MPGLLLSNCNWFSADKEMFANFLVVDKVLLDESIPLAIDTVECAFVILVRQVVLFTLLGTCFSNCLCQNCLVQLYTHKARPVS